MYVANEITLVIEVQEKASACAVRSRRGEELDVGLHLCPTPCNELSLKEALSDGVVDNVALPAYVYHHTR